MYPTRDRRSMPWVAACKVVEQMAVPQAASYQACVLVTRP